jgi:copper chaperone NosL
MDHDTPEHCRMEVPQMIRSFRTLLVAISAVLALTACGQQPGNASSIVPVEIDRSTSCALDGMLLADYPGPKGQIHYANRAEPDFFCDTVELLHIYLNPEVVVPVRAIFVQDMAKASWDAPQGHWIDARTAWYVHGSSRRGSMGPTLATFESETDARKFSEEFGGQALRFEDIKPDMVILDGGALHDTRM